MYGGIKEQTTYLNFLGVFQANHVKMLSLIQAVRCVCVVPHMKRVGVCGLHVSGEVRELSVRSNSSCYSRSRVHVGRLL